MNLDVRIGRLSKYLLKVGKKDLKSPWALFCISCDFKQTFAYCSKALKLFP